VSSIQALFVLHPGFNDPRSQAQLDAWLTEGFTNRDRRTWLCCFLPVVSVLNCTMRLSGQKSRDDVLSWYSSIGLIQSRVVALVVVSEMFS
jgi:hypothetical protein